MRYYGSPGLDYPLRQPFSPLGRLMPDGDSGRPLPPVEMAVQAVLLCAIGYEVIPTYGHHGRCGFRLGYLDRIIGM